MLYFGILQKSPPWSFTWSFHLGRQARETFLIRNTARERTPGATLSFLDQRLNPPLTHSFNNIHRETNRGENAKSLLPYLTASASSICEKFREKLSWVRRCLCAELRQWTRPPESEAAEREAEQTQNTHRDSVCVCVCVCACVVLEQIASVCLLGCVIWLTHTHTHTHTHGCFTKWQGGGEM